MSEPTPHLPARSGGRTSPPAEADAVSALARQVERLRRTLDAANVEGLRGEVRGLALTVARMAEEVAKLADAGVGREKPAPSWLWPSDASDPQFGALAAEALLDGLVDWARRVYIRFPDGSLPECWLWHPDVVEELLWLWKAWQAAYRDPGASVQRAGDWHDRQRPGVARRIRAAAGNCSMREHLEPASPPMVPVADAIPAVADWWVDPARSAPVPSSEQIRAADAAHRPSAGAGRR
jgi:hypothetical protein